MNKQISVSAPGKLMFFGEHSVVYGHPCIVTAVNQRIHTDIELTDNDFFELHAKNVGIYGYKKSMKEIGKGEIPKGARFVEIAVKNILESHPYSGGVKITTHSEFSSLLGFGSSSASTVCIIKGLSELLDMKLDNKQLFDLSYKTVLEIQGNISGFDIAVGIYGGTLYFVKPVHLRGGRTSATFDVDVLLGGVQEGIPLIVAYSGTKADTPTLVRQVAKLKEEKPEFVHTIFNKITELVEEAKIAFIEKDWKKIGELMNINQEYLQSLGVSTEKLDSMTGAAKKAGAYGVKLSGAGGGDCIIALAPDEKKEQVKKAIQNVEGLIIDVQTNAEGARIEL